MAGMGNFISTYGTEIALLAAVVNGFIALAMGQLFKHRPCLRVTLVVVAGILSAGAVGTSFYKRHAEIERRDEIGRQLDAFLGEGLKLIENCGNNTIPPKWKETHDWRQKIAEFVDAKMGRRYALSLSDPAGIQSMLFVKTPMPSTIWSTDFNTSLIFALKNLAKKPASSPSEYFALASDHRPIERTPLARMLPRVMGLVFALGGSVVRDQSRQSYSGS